MKGNVDGEEAKARLKARKRMMDCFSDTRNKRQLEQINFTHFTFANRTCKAPERRHNHKVNFINSAVALKKKVQFREGVKKKPYLFGTLSQTSDPTHPPRTLSEK